MDAWQWSLSQVAVLMSTEVSKPALIITMETNEVSKRSYHSLNSRYTKISSNHRPFSEVMHFFSATMMYQRKPKCIHKFQHMTLAQRKIMLSRGCSLVLSKASFLTNRSHFCISLIHIINFPNLQRIQNILHRKYLYSYSLILFVVWEVFLFHSSFFFSFSVLAMIFT